MGKTSRLVEDSSRSVSRCAVGIIIIAAAIARLLDFILRPNEALLGITPNANGRIA